MIQYLYNVIHIYRCRTPEGDPVPALQPPSHKRRTGHLLLFRFMH